MDQYELAKKLYQNLHYQDELPDDVDFEEKVLPGLQLARQVLDYDRSMHYGYAGWGEWEQGFAAAEKLLDRVIKRLEE